MKLTMTRWVGIGVLAAAVASFAAWTLEPGRSATVSDTGIQQAHDSHSVLPAEPHEHKPAEDDDLTVTASTPGVAVSQQTEEIPDPPEGKVAIRLNFRYHPEPLPGEAITLWTPQEEAAGLWNACHCEKGEPLPRDEPIPDRTVFLRPGGEDKKMVMLVFENPTKEKLEWQALIPGSEPSDLETRAQIWPTCFCVATPHWAPPEGFWYRVIRIRVGPKLEPGTKVDLTWTVLTDLSDFKSE